MIRVRPAQSDGTVCHCPARTRSDCVVGRFSSNLCPNKIESLTVNGDKPILFFIILILRVCVGVCVCVVVDYATSIRSHGNVAFISFTIKCIKQKCVLTTFCCLNGIFFLRFRMIAIHGARLLFMEILLSILIVPVGIDVVLTLHYLLTRNRWLYGGC